MPGIARWWPLRALRDRPATSPVERLERKVGVGISMLVPIFAVIGAVIMFSDDGPASLGGRVLCAAVLLSTIPVGAWWWTHGRDIVRMPGWFVFYADVGVTAVLVTFSDRGLALHATVLFAVIGIYIAYFSSTRVLLVHSAFISAVIVAFAAGAYYERVYDGPAVIAQALVALVVVNSVLVFRAVIKAQLDLGITDSLTGLLNRRGFETRIERMLTEAQPGENVGIFVVDLDRFKSVNDTSGHAAGDGVLRSTAYRLANAVPDGSIVARTGGEEFAIAVLMHPVEAAALGDRVVRSLYEPNDDISVTGSVGAAMLPVDAWKDISPVEAAEMVHSAILKADTAMYEAKRSGGNQARTFAR